jgi:hypothetical protein
MILSSFGKKIMDFIGGGDKGRIFWVILVNVWIIIFIINRLLDNY